MCAFEEGFFMEDVMHIAYHPPEKGIVHEYFFDNIEALLLHTQLFPSSFAAPAESPVCMSPGTSKPNGCFAGTPKTNGCNKETLKFAFLDRF